MMSRHVALAIVLWAVGCAASTESEIPGNLDAQARSQLAERSRLDAGTLDGLLADCDASQQAMMFCRWRDQIVADLELDQVVAARNAPGGGCPDSLVQSVDAWRQQRHSACTASAQAEWGEGSMQATALAICNAEATQVAIARLKAGTSCELSDPASK